MLLSITFDGFTGIKAYLLLLGHVPSFKPFLAPVAEF